MKIDLLQKERRACLLYFSKSPGKSGPLHMIRQMVGITDHVGSEASPDTRAVDHQTVRKTEEIFALLLYAKVLLFISK